MTDKNDENLMEMVERSAQLGYKVRMKQPVSDEEIEACAADIEGLGWEETAYVLDEGERLAQLRCWEKVMSKEELEIALLDDEYRKKMGNPGISRLNRTGHYLPEIEAAGGSAAVYRQCLEKGITWMELVGYKGDYDKDFSRF